MAAKLIAEEGILEGLVLSFDEGEEWVIGRDAESSQLVLSDPEASRKHLLARKTPEGIVVENLSTTNPVLVNDEELREPRLLQHGDAVKLGSGTYRYYTEIGPNIEGLEEETPPVIRTDTSSTQFAPTEEEHEDTLFDEEIKGDKELLAEIDFGVTEAGRFMLKVIAGPNNGAEFSMEPGRSYIVGTAPNAADVVFQDISVSRQHARLTIDSNDQVFIEDMQSRNGTLLDDVKITGKVPLPSNTVVAMGTTSFIVVDREGEHHTIITPLLPSIVKVLQDEEAKREEKRTAERAAESTISAKSKPPQQIELKKKSRFGPRTIMAVAALIGLFVLVAVGTSTLFRSQEIVVPEVDTTEQIAKALAAYPNLQYSFSRGNGNLLLIGHVLTAVDRSQILYNLQGLRFVKNVDDSNLIIDEYVWKEINLMLSRNPEWRGVTLLSPSPGKFVLSGYLKTKKQSDKLAEYMVQNFPYLDRLEKKVIVEEEETAALGVLLNDSGFRDVTAEMSNGEVTLSGTMMRDQAPKLADLVERIKARPTVRTVKNFVTEIEPEQSVIDLSQSYVVTGSSNQNGVNLSVVINGRILTRGDTIDGMSITEITRRTIYLDRDGVKYKIEYNK